MVPTARPGECLMDAFYEWTPATKRGEILTAVGIGMRESSEYKRANVVRTMLIQVRLLRQYNPELTIVLVRRPVDIQYEEVSDADAELLIQPRVDAQCRYSKDEVCIGGFENNCKVRGACDSGHGPIPPR